ncbi:MAG: phosphocholine cytidylyltransferase family protein [bacterium]|nr:phosphocholine cytidylyltransferase family protein [bacterium]
MRALILAAGRGLRLGVKTPKALLEVGGKTLLERLLGQFRVQGISEVGVVTGYCRDSFEPIVRQLGAYPIYNRDYASTDNLMSFYVGAELLDGPLILAHSDLIIEDKLLGQLIAATGDIVLPLDRSTTDVEAMKMVVSGDIVVDLGKTIPVEKAAGESIPLMKFSTAGLKAVKKAVAAILDEKRPCRYLEEALVEVISRDICNIRMADVTGCYWIEIDNPSDLRRARRSFGGDDVPA